MTTFITGGTGQTGLALARLLHASNHPVLLASRKGAAPAPFQSSVVTFDWFDPSTFENPFKFISKTHPTAPIDRAYLVNPDVADSLPFVQPFIDLAVKKGVKRFVLCSFTGAESGGIFAGKTHAYIESLGVDYTVLRPTWFMENFGLIFYDSVRENNEVFSGAANGRFPFVSVSDIAQAAYESLTEETSANTDKYILGPQAYSYEEAASLLSEVLGRKITYKRINHEEMVNIFLACGTEKAFAEILASKEAETEDGREERLLLDRKAIIGKATLKAYFEANRELWIKA